MTRNPFLMAVVCLAGALAAGCKSKEEKQAEQQAAQLQQSVEQMQKGSEALAKGLGDMAKGLNAAVADANTKPVEPVDFRALEQILPDLAGWEREKPHGQRMTSPVSYAEAGTTLHKGDASVDVTITDSANNQILLAPIAMALSGSFSSETDDGYEKSVTIEGAPGSENWNKSDKSGEIKLFVAKRFIVDVEAHGIDDPKLLRGVLDRTDLKKLAGLK